MNKKFDGKNTRLVTNTKGKSLTVMNTEITYKDNFRKMIIKRMIKENEYQYDARIFDKFRIAIKDLRDKYVTEKLCCIMEMKPKF